MNEDKNKTPEKANEAETRKQNQDFPNIPASSEKQNPPDISKNDIKKSSENHDTGKTDNTEINEDED